MFFLEALTPLTGQWMRQGVGAPRPEPLFSVLEQARTGRGCVALQVTSPFCDVLASYTPSA